MRGVINIRSQINDNKRERGRGDEPKLKEKPEEDMSCLLAMMIPTELITFIAQAPMSETDEDFRCCSFSAAISLVKPDSDPDDSVGGMKSNAGFRSSETRERWLKRF